MINAKGPRRHTGRPEDVDPALLLAISMLILTTACTITESSSLKPIDNVISLPSDHAISNGVSRANSGLVRTPPCSFIQSGDSSDFYDIEITSYETSTDRCQKQYHAVINTFDSLSHCLPNRSRKKRFEPVSMGTLLIAAGRYAGYQYMTRKPSLEA